MSTPAFIEPATGPSAAAAGGGTILTWQQRLRCIAFHDPNVRISKLSRSLSRGGEEPNEGAGEAAGEPAVERRGLGMLADTCTSSCASKHQRKRPSGGFKIPNPPLPL